MKIVLLSCASKKSDKKQKAQNLYISDYFKSNLNYAEKLNPDKIFVVSAKYGLLELDEEIGPYNLSLNNMSKQEREKWGKKVLLQLQEKTDLENDEFIFLCGEKYREFLISYIKDYKIPLKGLGIGKQLKFLKQNTKNICKEVHNFFNNLKRFYFPFNYKEIPENGIYVLFEKNEKAHNKDRIVRVGTHTGQNQLKSRLRQHFINKNKDRSIFRKNIGRALLNKSKNPYLDIWEIDLTTKKARENFSHLVDKEKQEKIENQVSSYIQNNFSFIIIPENNKERRLDIEKKLISTISLCKECFPSKKWLGRFSSKQKIRKSGLWLVNELYKNPLNSEELKHLKHKFS